MKLAPALCALWILTAPGCITGENTAASGPAGRLLVRTVASSEDAFAFCGNGQVRVEYRISELRPHVRFGTWSMQDGLIQIRWLKEKGGEPVGSPVFCGSVCEYSEYRPFERNTDQSEQLSWQEIRHDADTFWTTEPLQGKCSEMP